MAKDDYEVIVYQILAYLYQRLKKDLDVNPEHLMPQGKLFNINTNYWKFVIYNLAKDELVEGMTLTRVWGEQYPQIENLESIRITPKGIQFLSDNSFINRAKELLKDSKSIIPFI